MLLEDLRKLSDYKTKNLFKQAFLKNGLKSYLIG